LICLETSTIVVKRKGKCIKNVRCQAGIEDVFFLNTIKKKEREKKTESIVTFTNRTKESLNIILTNEKISIC
jgi:hypothetical protein